MKLDPELLSWCTPRQLEVLQAWERTGSHRKAALELGVPRGYIGNVHLRVKRKAALQGYSPDHDMTKTVPDGFKVKGVSTYYGEDGKPRGQWVKSQIDEAKREEMLRVAIDALKEEIPRLDALPAPKHATAASLCNCYVITDYHLSMLSHSEETGADWDVKIAEKTLLAWFAQAIAQAPDAEVAVFAQLSDLLHAPDAYAARAGWLSGRDAKVITYHREFGEVSRLTINSDMLR